MKTDEIKYCLSKQIDTADRVQTNYGDFDLDDEMRDALREILEKRLNEELKK